MDGENRTSTKNWLMLYFDDEDKGLMGIIFDDLYLIAKHIREENYRFIRIAFGMRIEYSRDELRKFFYIAN